MGEERESWSNHCEFFLSSLGLAVGLGNVWRFPYVAFQNGGGSFLVPYLLMLLLVGLPAFFLELSGGQYSRVGANKIWGRMVPALKGLGYGMLLVRFLVNIYYVVILAWCLIYLWAGFTSKLPWGECGNKDKNTIGCYSVDIANNCKDNWNRTDLTYYNGLCMNYTTFCTNFELEYNTQNNTESCINTTSQQSTNFEDLYIRYSPAEDYYYRVALGLIKDYDGNKHTWEDYGSLKWELVLCLFLSWLLVGLSLIGGIQKFGKVAYVITLSPYFVLTALLAYSAQRPGAAEGIEEFFKPDWNKLIENPDTGSFNYEIWSVAASQIFFSLSCGFGSQLVLSSYNKFTNNCHRDAWIISLCNSLTSIFAGVVVFAILGNLADGQDIFKVVKGGLGLAFVAYPEAVLKMDVSPLWSFFFFFMLVNLALSSICGGVQTFIAFVLDEKPSLAKHKKWIVVVGCCIFFVCGIPMCTTGGIHLFTIFDKKCTSSLLLLSLVEVILVAWVYGAEKFLGNIKEMSVPMPRVFFYYWKLMWIVVSPIILITITILAWVNPTPLRFSDKDDPYPEGVQAVGWLMEFTPTAIAILYPLWVIKRYREKGYTDPAQLLRRILLPSDSWEKKSGNSGINEDHINEAFGDAIYSQTTDEVVQTEGKQEKITEL